MIPLVRRFAEPMTQLRTGKVKVTLKGNVSYSSIVCLLHILEPFERFLLNFTQMFLSVRRCAESVTQLRSTKVKATLQGHGIL